MRTRSIIAALVAGLTVVPGAKAATIRAGIEPFTYTVRATIRIEAKPGERNDLIVTVTDVVRVTDDVPLDAGQGCHSDPDGSVVCDPEFADRPQLYLDAGDLADEVRIEAGERILSAHLDGGDGDDLLIGGGTEDWFTGGNGNDRMVGGPGTNLFYEGPAANGSDSFDGGGTVGYGERVNPVRVDLDGEADDGEPGEHDRVPLGIDSVYGGRAADRLVGNYLPNYLSGGPGPDVLIGREGDDSLVGGSTMYGRISSDDRLYGGAGVDQLTGGAGDDLVVGGPGKDHLDTFAGADRLFPGQGGDTVRAGPGDDLVNARDRAVDVVNCGLGQDRARNDPVDWLVAGLCDRHDPGRRLRRGKAVRP